MSEPNKGVGRPEKISEQLIAKLCEALSLGATYKIASLHAGISHMTLHRWLTKGESLAKGTSTPDEYSPLYLALWERTQQAQGIAAVSWLANINEAANAGDWKAGAWMLERRFKEDYGTKSVEMTMKGEEEAVVFYLPQKGSMTRTAPDLEPEPEE